MPNDSKGSYLKNWSTLGKLPRLWRQRIKDYTGYEPAPLANPREITGAGPILLNILLTPETAPLVSDNSPVQSFLTQAKKNIHEHPLLEIADLFNRITTDIQNRVRINQDELRALIDAIKERLPLLEGRQSVNTEYALGYLEELLSLLQSKSSAKERYIAWYFSLLHFKRTGDKFDQYFVNMESPDEAFR